jgi:hypothetical protein
MHRSPALSIPALVVAGLALSACAGTNPFGPISEPAPPPATIVPSKYTSEEFVGSWGYTSYQKEADRARTEVAARRLCRQPYVISKGPSGGLMMHLPDQKQATELVLKGSSDGKNYIGPPGEPGGSGQDREILSFDGRILITRFVEPDAANRYGNMVYVRCGARA